MSTAVAGQRQDSGEPPRKRVRKGTRSCWECKRRKIRCELSSEDVPVCAGCLARGTTCLSQEYPEEREPSSNHQVGERLGRVEHLLESLLAKISAFEDDQQAQKQMLTPDSMPSSDILAPSNPLSSLQQNTPLMTLFDNPVLGRRETVPSQASTPQSQSSVVKTPSSKFENTPRSERIRQTLADLLPSQKDADLISANSSSWLVIFALSAHTSDKFAADDTFSQMTTAFNMAEVAKGSPSLIARTLMFLTLCVQQLDPEFDTSRLSLLPTTEARMERWMSTIQALVTSDDELVTTIEGLECLVLQGVFHTNRGSLRRSWLAFRRALSLAQLMGIHRSNTDIPTGRQFWFQIVQSDRFLALLLGLPAATPEDVFTPEETFENPAIDSEQLMMRRLCNLAGKVIDRNQAQNTQAYAITQEIDEKLDALAKEMPASWWEVPEFRAHERSKKMARYFNRMINQIWYFQVENLLHLPFMLRASTERRYEYSKFSCLRSSRETLYRYLGMRELSARSFCCKIMDFSALTSTVTLLLGILQGSQMIETPELRAQKESDRVLVQTVLKALEEVSLGGKEIIATQSVSVIKSLLAMDTPAGRETSNLRLTIPYFGTVSIIRPKPAIATPQQQKQQLHTPPSLTSPAIYPLSQGMNYDADQSNCHSAPDAWNPIYQSSGSNFPMVSFTSSHFPTVMQEQGQTQYAGQDWNLMDADTVLFDSLLTTDVDGNWVL
ncbi:hypothetical protein HYFRA_00003507 [Hymenoscyphus fraxineus]|uniref:Zn(2)-C6 fungal-type domain-containing protein n=1 Tax=Hymenoscyphus fraxineus TaxID=746836 RepID=A0A9N9PRN8_9HELO|nr:hypothetical protein HYFRA_00003507 [Hymenoscyphus fraxineus]